MERDFETDSRLICFAVESSQPPSPELINASQRGGSNFFVRRGAWSFRLVRRDIDYGVGVPEGTKGQGMKALFEAAATTTG